MANLIDIDNNVTSQLESRGNPNEFYATPIDMTAFADSTYNINGTGSFWSAFSLGKIFVNASNFLRTTLGFGHEVQNAVAVAHTAIDAFVAPGSNGQIGIYGSRFDDQINAGQSNATLSLSTFDGDDHIILSRGVNNVDAGAGRNVIEIPTQSFDTSSDVRATQLDTLRFLSDREGAHVTQITLFNNGNGNFAIRVTTDSGSAINIHTNDAVAARVANSFGVQLPNLEQPVEINGAIGLGGVNAVLDRDAGHSTKIDPSLFSVRYSDGTPNAGEAQFVDGGHAVVTEARDVVVNDGTLEFHGTHGTIWSNTFVNADGTVDGIAIGSRVDAVTVAGGENGPLHLNGTASSASALVYGTQYDDIIDMANVGASQEQTTFGLYKVIRQFQTITDENGQPTTNPDVPGFQWWQGQIASMEGQGQNGMLEAAKTFIQFIPNALTATNEQFATQMYRTVLGREPEAGAVEALVNHMNHMVATNEGWTIDTARAQALLNFVNSGENMDHNGLRAEAEAWGDAVNIRMGAQAIINAGAGNDFIRATLGDDNINGGAGADIIEIRMTSYGVKNISIEAADDVRFIDDRAGSAVTRVEIFNNEGATSTVQLTTDNGAIINLFAGDKYLADRIAYSFGAESPGVGNSVVVQGNFNAATMTSVLNLDAPEAFIVDRSFIDGSNLVVGTSGADKLFGLENHDNTLIGNGGIDDFVGANGNDIAIGQGNFWLNDGNDIAIATGPSKMNTGAGSDIGVIGSGTDAWLGANSDLGIFDFSANSSKERGTIGDFEAGDALAAIGLKADDTINYKVFENGNSLQLTANGQVREVFTDEWTIDQIILGLNNGRAIGENDVLEGSIKASAFNDKFSTSANGEFTAPDDAISVDEVGILRHNPSWTPDFV